MKRFGLRPLIFCLVLFATPLPFVGAEAQEKACEHTTRPKKCAQPSPSPTPTTSPTDASYAIQIVSNRADIVSGGNALVEITSDSGNLEGLSITLNGADVTSDFATRPNGLFMGVVTGMTEGDNELVASAPGGSGARLTITNHPIGGPIFSGPQIQPWYCLPDALDAQCNRPVRYQYFYKSSVTGQFNPYDPHDPPADLATTTTDQGKTVPYIVREEIGSVDRGQYRIAVLDTPDSEWNRWTGPPAWNHKVYVLHGGGCGVGHSETNAPGVLSDAGLRRGFAVMSTGLEHSQENCNLVVQAESVMMAKEHLIETYGDIRYLFGSGGSGGALAELQMANAYPGLYDGLIAGATFSDAALTDLLDCEALQRYFDDPRRWAPGVVWTEASMAAASGKASTSVCRLWTAPGGPTAFSRIYEPRSGSFSCDVPGREPNKAYNPQTNPAGVRCTLQDYLANIFGLRPPSLWGPIEQKIGRGFANRPYDNVGIQYGLRALQAGAITAAQFVDLNAKIGAVDIDFGTQPERVAADPAALAAPYRSGFVNEANNLDLVSIIDLPGGFPGDRYEIHDIYKTWALRARLDAANGHHDNHIIWYGPEQSFQNSFGTMDSWLAAIEQDGRDVPREQKVLDNKPSAARDRCDFPNPASCDFLFGPGVYNARWGAGDGIATDVLKCQLKPLVRSDYAPIVLTDAQWGQLEGAFPTGVCDWSQPGVGQQHTIAWQTYVDGPGGRPLGPPPVSTPNSGQ
jgi:hypothetical protein